MSARTACRFVSACGAARSCLSAIRAGHRSRITCHMCKELLQDAHRLPDCGHMACGACIQRLFDGCRHTTAASVTWRAYRWRPRYCSHGCALGKSCGVLMRSSPQRIEKVEEAEISMSARFVSGSSAFVLHGGIHFGWPACPANFDHFPPVPLAQLAEPQPIFDGIPLSGRQWRLVHHASRNGFDASEADDGHTFSLDRLALFVERLSQEAHRQAVETPWLPRGSMQCSPHGCEHDVLLLESTLGREDPWDAPPGRRAGDEPQHITLRITEAFGRTTFGRQFGA